MAGIALQRDDCAPLTVFRELQTAADFTFLAAVPFQSCFFCVSNAEVAMLDGVDHQF